MSFDLKLFGEQVQKDTEKLDLNSQNHGYQTLGEQEVSIPFVSREDKTALSRPDAKRHSDALRPVEIPRGTQNRLKCV